MAVMRFGAFVFDVTTGELTRQGRRVALQDQPARVLALLVAHAGQLVTRDELRQALWPDDTFVEFETAIAIVISKIRRALGDSAGNPRFVETVPKHGYRFLADVHPLSGGPPAHSTSHSSVLVRSIAAVAGLILIAAALGATLAKHPEPLTRHATTSIEANRWYLQGRWHMDRRTMRDLHAAIAAFTRATEADASFAPAYAWLANAYGMLAYFGAIPPIEGGAFLAASAERALQLDPNLAAAQFARAAELAFFKWRFVEADRFYRRALELEPDYAEGHHWYAVYLQNMGRMDAALAERRRANELDPDSVLIALGMGDYYLLAGQPERALGQAEQLIRRNPSLPSAHTQRGEARVQLRQFDRAVADLEFARQGSPDSPVIAAWLASALHGAGRSAEARQLVTTFVNRAQSEYISPFEIAMMYAGIDDRDDSFHWLMKACDVRDPRLIMVGTSVRSDRLRDDSRFGSVLECVGLPPLAHRD